MLQPIAVLREAGVNWWWLCIQNSRFSDTLLVRHVVPGGPNAPICNLESTIYNAVADGRGEAVRNLLSTI